MTWGRFLWNYISHRKDLLAVVLLCAIVMATAELSIPWMIKEAVDAILDEHADLNLNRWLLSTLAILAALYAAYALMLRADAHMILHCSYNLRRRFFHHVQSQALPFFQRHPTGELIHRATSDTKLFETSSAQLFRDVPAELLVVIGVVMMMVQLDIGLTVVTISFMSLAAAVTGYLGQPLPGIRKSAQRIAARLTARFQEGISGIRTVQAFKNEGYELACLDAENQRVLDVELKEGKVYSLMEPLGDLLELLGLVVVVWYGGRLMMAEKITVGTLIAFITYMEILARSLGHAEMYYRAMQSSRAVGARLQELLADHDMLPTGSGLIPEDNRSIQVEGVSFRYSGSERKVLSDVSFTARQGEVIAIAGPNGAGKSTLTDLILRFYDPTTGRILVGGVDLRELDLAAWRRSVGVMSQEVFLFHGSIAENIAYGRPGASREDIDRVVQETGLSRVLRQLPEGLETVVGERGTQLSGGERQSIALARLFLRKPRLLILDEPTSYLDGEALPVVLAALRSLMTGCTTFIVTHNLETIHLAERVLFLESGRLYGDDTHEKLYANNPRYRALWEEATERHQTVKKN